jgi:cell division protein FtsZ
VGALTVGVVTKPFHFEGKKRMKNAVQGISWLRENVDSLIMIPNNRLLAIAGSSLSMLDAFKRADEVLLNAVQGISDLINHTGLINSDFADVRTIMQNKGLALMGIGFGEGDHRAVEAATNAISSPLLEDVSINGATGIIINITGGANLTIHEVNEATTLIMEAAHEDAEIIFGTVIDETLKEKVKVTVIATGLGIEAAQALGAVATPTQPYAPNVSAPAMQAMPTMTQAALMSAPTTMGLGASASVASQVSIAQAALNSVVSAAAPLVNAPALGASSAGPAIFAESEFDSSDAASIAPPQPRPEMLAAAAAFVKGGSAFESSSSPISHDQNEMTESSEPTVAAPSIGLASQKTTEGADLVRARAIAQRLGITNLTDDEYDIPAYLRRQQEREN